MRSSRPTAEPRTAAGNGIGRVHGRSHAQGSLGQQLYPVLEQCRKPEVLWAELVTDDDDWLGVRRNGTCVLGRPRLSAVLPEEPGPPPDDTRAPHRIESGRLDGLALAAGNLRAAADEA